VPKKTTKEKRSGTADLALTERSLSIALLRSREAVMEHFRPMLKTHGVTEQQWRVMRVLSEVGASDASRVAQLACVLRPSLSRIIKTLETRCFIQTVKDDTDARKTLITLTPAGIAFLAALTPQSTMAYQEIEKRLGKKRIDKLLDELGVLLDKLEDINK